MDPITIGLLILGAILFGELIFIGLCKLVGPPEEFRHFVLGKMMSLLIAGWLIAGFYYNPNECAIIICFLIILFAMAILNQLWFGDKKKRK